MILIDCPACDAPVATSLPLPDAIRCDDCAVTWEVTDAEPIQEVKRAA
jgi:hypothetical protein